MLDESLTCLSHTSMLKTKLRTVNSFLAKLRHYTSSKLLKTIYNALFESYKPYRNCLKIQQINTITIQEERTVINSIYPKLEPPTMGFNQ